MALNTNTQAITFANSKIRPMADELYSCYLSAKKINDLWTAQAVAIAIPNDANIINDGAAVDGRAQITDAQATLVITRCQEMISWMENGLVASPFGTTTTKATLNTVSAVQVNGAARF
jgi:hypothetical protein